jgi:nitroreductase
MSGSVIAAIRRRKHTGALALTMPAPDAGQIERLIEAAAAAPDHGKLVPFRFILIGTERRQAFAGIAADALLEANPAADEVQRRKTTEKTLQAPALVAVIACLQPAHPKIVLSDQWLAVGCALQNLWLAAEDMGFACGVTSGPLLGAARMRAGLGLAPDEHCVSLVAIGTPRERLEPRAKPPVASLLSHF